MGPGTTLQIYDASQSRFSDEAGLREYTGYDGLVSKDIIIEAGMVGITFSADSSAEPSMGPKVEYEVLPEKSGISNSNVVKMILAGGVLLLSGYIILAAVAWRRFKANETQRRQVERSTARYAPPVPKQ